MKDWQLENLPDQLLRFYGDCRWAEAFGSEGSIRLRRIQFYQHIEDASRNDPDEGEGRLRVPGQVPVIQLSKTGSLNSDWRITDRSKAAGHFNFGTVWIHPTYVFCTCLPTVQRQEVMNHFGQELVRIFDPERFATELRQALGQCNFGTREIILLEGLPVRYDKDVVSELPLNEIARTRLAYGQKTSAYAKEYEYRFIVSLSRPGGDPPPDYLDVKMRNPSRFCLYAK